MTDKTLQADFDACLILILLILISGCTGGEDIENIQDNTVTSKVNKLSTNVLSLNIVDENKINNTNSNNRKVVRQIEINKIFKQNDIHELKKAAESGGLDLVSISSVRGKLGITPLHVASENGSNEILEYLNDFDINLNIQDNGGRTLLHTAITGNQVSTVKLLLKMGVNLNLKNKQDYTAMDVFMINKDILDNEIFGVLKDSNAKRSIELNK
jgi:ankyrin repeat protein